MSTNKLILSILIGLLTLGTAFYHLYLAFAPGFESLQLMFILDFIGYIIILIAFFLPQLEEYHEYVAYGLIIFTLINIVGYLIQNIDFLIFNEGIIAKSIEILLLIVIFVDFFVKDSGSSS